MSVLVQNHTTKMFCPFSAFLINLQKVGPRFSRPHTILFGTFCVLRPKFRPLGNTDLGKTLYYYRPKLRFANPFFWFLKFVASSESVDVK
jgi:hypothetical protein